MKIQYVQTKLCCKLLYLDIFFYSLYLSLFMPEAVSVLLPVSLSEPELLPNLFLM